MGRKTAEDIPVQLKELQVGVILEKDGILALDKPIGMDTFHAYFHYTGYPSLWHVIKENWPEGCHAHRIDRTTSGLHMAATNSEALSWIVRGWSGRYSEKIVHKSYLAVVDKVPKWDAVHVNLRIKPTPNSPGDCVTKITNLRDGSVQADLVWGGRYHQVRQACASVGLPLVGDTLYGGVAHDRIMLHNWKCTVDGWATVQAPTPEGFPHHETPTPWKWAIPVRPLTRDEINAHHEYRYDLVNQKTRSGSLPWKYHCDLRAPITADENFSEAS